MFGIDVIAYCPVCKKSDVHSLGCTRYVEYKNKCYALIHCYDCGNLLAAQTKDAYGQNDLSNGVRQVFDNTKIGLVNKLVKRLKSSDYDEKTPEDVLERELFQYAIDVAGECVAWKNEYEIKYIIQWLISHTFNVPDCSGLVSYVYDDIKDEAPVVSVTCW